MKLDEFITPKVLIALIFIICGFSGIYFVPNLSDSVHNRIFDVMFLIGAYYFGSSTGATKKDEVISNLAESKQSGSLIEKSENTTIKVQKEDGTKS